MQIYRPIVIAIAFATTVLSAAACRDETVRKTEEAAEAAGQDVKAGAKKAVEKTKQAGREIGEEVGPTLERAGEKLKEEGAELRRKVTDDDTTSPSAAAAPDAGTPAARK